MIDQRGEGGRCASVDDLVARAGLRRDEIVTLADIGALNSFGYDRRSALWQAERAVRPGGALFTINAEAAEHISYQPSAERESLRSSARSLAPGGGAPGASEKKDDPCPLK